MSQLSLFDPAAQPWPVRPVVDVWSPLLNTRQCRHRREEAAQLMARCRTCDARILWAKTTSGRLTPVDADSDVAWDSPILDEHGTLRPTGRSETGAYASVPIVEIVGRGQGSLDPDERRWRPHFATCPDADAWRRKT